MESSIDFPSIGLKSTSSDNSNTDESLTIRINEVHTQQTDKAPRNREVTGEDEQQNGLSMNKDWRFWAIFPGLCFSIILSALDASVTTTSLPTVVEELNSGELYLWIINAYFLASAAVQPFFGQAADILGRRILLIIAISLFLVGSALCGAAVSTMMLIIARAIQGSGGGGILTLTTMIVGDLVPLREREKYMSVLQAIFGIGMFIGPIIGGSIVTYTTWRWIFYLNIPVAGLALVLVILFLNLDVHDKENRRRNFFKLDFLGNLILMVSVISILIGLTWGDTKYQWSSWRVIVPLVLGLLGLIFFGIYETFIAKNPTMPPRLFSNRTSLAGFFMTFINGVIIGWVSYFLTLNFQTLKEESPIIAGVFVLPIILSIMPAGMVAGWTISITGHYRLVLFIGWCFMIVGAGLLTILTATTPPGVWIVIQVIVGIGMGAHMTSTFAPIQAPLAETDIALATSTLEFLRSFGEIWGVAVPAAIFNSRVSQLAYTITDTSVQDLFVGGRAYEHATKEFISSLDGNPQIKAQVLSVYTEALKRVWQILIPIACLGIPAVFVMRHVELRRNLKTNYGLSSAKLAEGDVEKVPDSRLKV